MIEQKKSDPSKSSKEAFEHEPIKINNHSKKVKRLSKSAFNKIGIPEYQNKLSESSPSKSSNSLDSFILDSEDERKKERNFKSIKEVAR